MTMMTRIAVPTTVREIDLCDAREVARADAFVRAQPGATPFHLPAWVQAIAAGCGQRARYLVAERGGGDLVGVLPLTEIRSLVFGKALVSAGFAVDGGVLGEGLVPLADAAWDLARRLGIGSVEFRGGAVPEGWAVDDTTYVGFARPLAANDEAEAKAIPKRQRAEIRRAATFDLSVATGRDAAMVGETYRLYAEAVRNLGTPVFPAALFREVVARLDADVMTVSHEGRGVATVLSLYLNGTCYPYWSGAAPASRAVRGHEHLLFALMRHARERGCTRFDLGRSKAGTGAAAFKKNLGFAPEPLVYARRTDGPARVVNPLDPRYALMVRTWKRLPLPVANLVGPWLARGLG